MNIRKGDYGYIRREKKKRLLVTLGLFVLPAIVFIVGLVLADGNKSNIFTVVAVVGCLPGCRAAVGFIMMVMQKPVDKAVYDAIEAKKGKLLMGYEMYITQEKSSLMIEQRRSAVRRSPATPRAPKTRNRSRTALRI